jgi:integrase/recombinase XerD
MKAFEEFLENKKRDKSSNTVIAYQYTIQKFIDYFKLEDASQIDNLKSNDYLNYQNALAKQYGNSAVNSHFRNISSFVNWLKKFHYIKNIPEINDIDPLKVKKKDIFYLTIDEQRAMIKNTKNNEKKLMILLMLQTGVRREEVTNIKVKDVFNGKLLVHRKGGSEQSISLTQEALDLIEKVLSKRKIQSEYLFAGRKGKKLSLGAVRLRVQSSAKKSGIKSDRVDQIVTHTMRKSCACALLQNNVPMSVVQKILGHSSITTTEKYYAEVASSQIADAIHSQASLI